MKFHRIVTLPFAFLADAATLGNICGDRSFTQQVFDAEEYERRCHAELEALKKVAETLAALSVPRP